MAGHVLAKWSGFRVDDLVVTPSGSKIICAYAEKNLNVLEVHQTEAMKSGTEDENIPESNGHDETKQR